MQRAATALVGTHDFSSFETAGAPRETSVRTVTRLEVSCNDSNPQQIIIEIEADGFLYNMVRAIVGTLVEVGRGGEPETWPAEVLAARNRSAGGPTAPPQGLFLVRVEYS
jgi:tRNA pseudouridine38-40 synthase